ncbi:Lymphocyte antigen 6 complex locus protein G6f [Camelus dromedarius]|uniref:Lymphocyte antigen 6 complex locus protein G6f n=1 Tax=Camelus dromedarius TaxID=9838 RepID=A0A5N4CSY0_CAMDR|nr:Lymphocyte antigen 6 complex locus protein G6f [Camelus dromedarius]
MLRALDVSTYRLRLVPNNIQAIYVALGETLELPCPSPPTLHGDEILSWFRSPATVSSTVLVAQVQMVRPTPYSGKLQREPQLKLLGNYSLWLEGSKEGDAGRYWCAVLGQHNKYQNWRVYDVSVLRDWGVPWILMLLLAVGQGIIILVLSIMLWRWRVQGSQGRGEEGPTCPQDQVILMTAAGKCHLLSPWSSGT